MHFDAPCGTPGIRLEILFAKSAELNENKMAAKSPRLSVSLSAAEQAEVQRLADSSNVSCSWVIRQAVVEYLERHAGIQPPLPLLIKKGKN